MQENIFGEKSYDKILRQFLIIGLLEEGPKNKSDIYGELISFYGEEKDVSFRTIERDLQNIKEFWGIQIEKEKGEDVNRQKYCIETKKGEPNYINVVEIMITYIFKDNLLRHSITPVLQNVKSPFLLFMKIHNAITKHKHIIFDYFFDNKDYKREDMDLEPYDLVHRHGKWLLLGVSQKNPEENVVKQYYVHNISNLRINHEAEPFKIKTHLYSREEYYKYAWDIFVSDEITEIEIWFSEKAANKIKNFPYHPTQEIEETENGIIVKLKTWGYIEVVNWVLGFGKDAKILKPADCIEYIKNKLNVTLWLYE